MTVLGCLLESPRIKQTALETAAFLIEHGAATRIQIGPDGTPLLSHCINQGINPGPAFAVLFGEHAPGALLEDPQYGVSCTALCHTKSAFCCGCSDACFSFLFVWCVMNNVPSVI